MVPVVQDPRRCAPAGLSPPQCPSRVASLGIRPSRCAHLTDKPINGFGHGEEALNAAKAVEVIKETNEFYLKLKAGETDAGKLSLK